MPHDFRNQTSNADIGRVFGSRPCVSPAWRQLLPAGSVGGLFFLAQIFFSHRRPGCGFSGRIWSKRGGCRGVATRHGEAVGPGVAASVRFRKQKIRAERGVFVRSIVPKPLSRFVKEDL
jgi:hypothetical protein